jgi:uncharacterized sulfatase
MRPFMSGSRVIALAMVFLATRAAVAAPPNVIFVLLDDMGYADLTCYGERRTRTEHADRLASEGIRFTQYYVNAPICSPSRTALTTGQFPARWRITSFLASRAENEKRGMPQWLDPAAPTLARHLKAAGYATGHFGKWHMGGQRDVGDAPLPADYGFDKTLTNFEGLGDRVLPLLDAFDGKPAKRYALGSDALGRGEITWADRSIVTGRFVDAAIAFMRDAAGAGKPFFVNVWPDDVHSPFFPPAALRGDGTKQALYLGVVRATDRQLGPLFDFVRDDPKLRDNTWIVLASDNGPEPGAGSAGPFRGHKGNLYEGGLRSPLIVWGPGLMPKAAAGTTNDATVISAVDVLPSVLALAGVKLPPGDALDGEDLGATMLGRARATRTKPLFWVRPPDRPGPPAYRFPDLAVRDGDWKLLIDKDGGRPQLYDLSKDPGEATNLAAAKVDIVRRLKTMALAWRKTLPIDRMNKPAADAAPKHD